MANVEPTVSIEKDPDPPPKIVPVPDERPHEADESMPEQLIDPPVTQLRT